MWSWSVELLVLASITLCVTSVGRAEGGGDVSISQAGTIPSPRLWEVSAAEQSEWLDHNIPKLAAAMRASKEVRDKVAGPLAAVQAPPFPLTPRADGLAPDDLKRLSALVHAAVVGNPRYGSVVKVQPSPVVTKMPQTRIVRIEVVYPAPPATKDLEPGPLTIDVWVCPDWETALALFWLRKGGVWHLDPTSPEALRRSVLGIREDAMGSGVDDGHPGEVASWDFPRGGASVVPAKGYKPMPVDRLLFLRGSTLVEASTIEFTWRQEWKKWLAFPLEKCVPDIVAITRAIDAGLVRFARPEPPRSK